MKVFLFLALAVLATRESRAQLLPGLPNINTVRRPRGPDPRARPTGPFSAPQQTLTGPANGAPLRRNLGPPLLQPRVSQRPSFPPVARPSLVQGSPVVRPGVRSAPQVARRLTTTRLRSNNEVSVIGAQQIPQGFQAGELVRLQDGRLVQLVVPQGGAPRPAAPRPAAPAQAPFTPPAFQSPVRQFQPPQPRFQPAPPPQARTQPTRFIQPPPPVAPARQSITCQNQPDGYYGEQNNNRVFHQCANGIDYKIDCPQDTTWNQAALKCLGTGDPELVKLRQQGLLSRQQQTFTASKKLQPDALINDPPKIKLAALDCQSLPNGQYADEDNCQGFHQCSGGNDYALACPDGLWWSTQYTQCVSPANSDCKGRIPEPLPLPKDDKEYEFDDEDDLDDDYLSDYYEDDEEEAPSQAVDPNNPCLQGDGYLPNLSDNSRYIQCTNGQKMEMTCPHNLVWTQERLRCLHPPGSHAAQDESYGQTSA